jgi:hypothetical protein
MNRKRRKKVGTEQQDWSLNLEVVHPNAAGIDIGNESHYVAVAPDRDSTPVRQFACFTEDVHRLAGSEAVASIPWPCSLPECTGYRSTRS